MYVWASSHPSALALGGVCCWLDMLDLVAARALGKVHAFWLVLCNPNPHFQHLGPIAPLAFSRYFRVMPPGDLRKGLGAFACCGQLTSQPDMPLRASREWFKQLRSSSSFDLWLFDIFDNYGSNVWFERQFNFRVYLVPARCSPWINLY